MQGKWRAPRPRDGLRAANAGRRIHDFSAPAGHPTRSAVEHVALGHSAHALAIVSQNADRADAGLALDGTGEGFIAEAEIAVFDLHARMVRQAPVVARARLLREHSRHLAGADGVAELAAHSDAR